MGRGAVSLREEIGGPAVMDRSAARRDPCLESNVAGRRIQAAGIGAVLPADPIADEPTATTRSSDREVALHDLWFALPRHEQEQFGGHFSRMLLRVFFSRPRLQYVIRTKHHDCKQQDVPHTSQP